MTAEARRAHTGSHEESEGGVVEGPGKGSRGSWLYGLAVLAVAETVLGAVLAQGQGVTAKAWAESNIAGSAVTALATAAAAMVVLRDNRSNRLGWLFLAVAHLEAATVLGNPWVLRSSGNDGSTVFVAWVAANTWWLGLMLLTFVPLLFPDGQLPSPRWRPVGMTAAAAFIVGGLTGVGSGLLVQDAFPELDVAVPGAVAPTVVLTVAVSSVVVLLACAAAAMVGVFVRLRRASGPQRGQLSWFLFGFLALLVLEQVPGQPWAGLVGNALFPVALAVAIVRHDLFGGERLLSRTIVYGVLTGVVLATVGVGAAIVGAGVAGSFGGIFLAALAVAIGLEPLRRGVQTLVDRLLFDGPRDPYLALRTAGDELARAEEDPLGAVTRSLVRSLHVRHAELLPTDVTRGESGPGTVDAPLRIGSERVGVLRVHLREGRTRLDPADEALLRDLLPQVAAAARTAALLQDALTARADLLRGVEEERRRLRRDLHDGVGPTLAGLCLGLSSVQAALEKGEHVDAGVVSRLERQARGCLHEVREVVEDLRPSALDGLGLVGALREHASSLTSGWGGVEMCVDTASVTALPAAVELVTYRCLMEAMTNAAVHAKARRCEVRVRVNGGSVEAEVVDDGIGIEASQGQNPGTGTGLPSIALRVGELGGRVDVQSSEAGTRVRLCLPVVDVPGRLAIS